MAHRRRRAAHDGMLHGARLRDGPCRRGAVRAQPFGDARRIRRERAPAGASPGTACPPSPPAHRGRDRGCRARLGGRLRGPLAGGACHRRQAPRGPRSRGRRPLPADRHGRRRDAHLHEWHHRPAQGGDAHPSQCRSVLRRLRGAGRHRPRRSRPQLPAPGPRCRAPVQRVPRLPLRECDLVPRRAHQPRPPPSRGAPHPLLRRARRLGDDGRAGKEKGRRQPGAATRPGAVGDPNGPTGLRPRRTGRPIPATLRRQSPARRPARAEQAAHRPRLRRRPHPGEWRGAHRPRGAALLCLHRLEHLRGVRAEREHAGHQHQPPRTGSHRHSR